MIFVQRLDCMVNIIKYPPAFILSGMPAWFVVDIGSALEPENKITATIHCDSQQVGQDHAYASLDGKAYFELSEFFDAAITPNFTQIGETSQIVTLDSFGSSRLSKTFTVTFTDKDNNSDHVTITAVKGRMTPDAIAKLNYGIGTTSIKNYLESSQGFLTTRPDRIKVRYADQPERLSFAIHSAYLEGGDIDLVRTLHLADGSTQSSVIATLPSPTLGDVFQIRTSYKSLVALQIQQDPDNPVLEYHVQLIRSGSPLSKVIRYEVDFSAREPESFIWLNCMGGFDTFCPTGVKETEYSSERNITPLVPVPGFKLPSYLLSDTSESAEMLCNTGFVDLETLNWLSQLIFSRQAYKIGGQAAPVPIICTKNSLSVNHHSDNLLSASFRYVLNHPAMVEEFDK